ncbi:Retrovirus-related Pol polyprotein from transposon 17.6 [Araneus ventricosus]|uniref:RNA-directed DNA polymerase n=1 Tax=Araneus ventricosus TaxID=182803 RepID=A0A4Y2WBY7_ARAVE|nr:Retrovirus-related Pol polyprotein from transposon 17.6 [Araneus ventricosus]GBO34073.1 Retrovirus-related Pol polyprotein from transposon 17.6 [Araneus ventricosus]
MQIVKISPIHKIAIVENVNNVTSSNASKQIDWATQVNLTHLNEDQKLRVMDLLSKYNSVFVQDITDLGVCDLIKHEIHLQDQVPTSQKPYRAPYHLKPEMKRQINILLEAGIIQQSISPFAAPVLLVKKSDGSYRLVADLRKLNAKTIPDNFPLPNLNEMIDNLAGAKIFSTLDLTSDFHQMVMHPDHTKYTAIATEFGLYEYKRLPFGLKNASASFQRLMNLVLAGLNEFQISCYIDDLVIASTDVDGHIDKLKMVFDRLIKANLKVKPSMCSFLKQDITYLDHTVKEGQVFPDKKNLDAIRKALPPKSRKQDNLLLCYQNSNDRHSENAKLVVPQSLVHKILNLTHDSDIVPHPDLTRNLKRIKQNYFWHGLYNQDKPYIGSCHSCVRRRGFCKNVNAPVQKIPTADYPFQKVAFDTIGPLVTSKHGNKYIIVISDYFTRYAEAYPLPNIQISNVARVLIDFISRHCVMQTLYSDRGSNFLSKAMQEVYDKLGITKQQTLAFNPRGNGLVERLNKTLIDSLSHLVSVKQEDWCEYLPFALMAFRNAFHTILKECPSYLVFGRDPVMPYHLVYSDKFRSYSDEPSYAQELVSKLQYSFDLVKENLEKAAEKNSKRNVSLPVNKKIEIGYLVYLHTPKIKIHTSKNLATVNHGPFRVINKLSPVIFGIQRVNQPAKRQKVHLNTLVKVLEREIFPSIEDNVESNEPNVIVNQNDQNSREKDVMEEYPPLCFPYRKISSILNFNNYALNNYPVIQTNNASFSHSLPATPNFGSPSSSFSGDQYQSTPNSMLNASANASPNLNQGLNVQNTHPYNLRPRNIFGMVKYNNH